MGLIQYGFDRLRKEPRIVEDIDADADHRLNIRLWLTVEQVPKRHFPTWLDIGIVMAAKISWKTAPSEAFRIFGGNLITHDSTAHHYARQDHRSARLHWRYRVVGEADSSFPGGADNAFALCC